MISKQLFEKVQNILDGRTQKNKTKHNHTYSKLIKCECGNHLITSIHKDRKYLECQNKDCRFASIREDRLEDQIMLFLSKYEIGEEFQIYYEEAIKRMRDNIRQDTREKRAALNLKIGQLDKKLDNLYDAVLGDVFSPEEALAKKNQIISERRALKQELDKAEDKSENTLWNTTQQVIRAFKQLPYQYKEFNPILKRRLLSFLTSNCQLQGSELFIEAVPMLKEIKITQDLLRARKLISNHQLHGKRPLLEAIDARQKTANSAVLPHGRPFNPTIEQQTLRFEEVYDEVISSLKHHLSTESLASFNDLYKHVFAPIA